MIIRDDGAQWTAIGQPAHAWLAAQVARVWGTGELLASARPEEFALGVAQHDIAWVDWDRRPPLHAPARRAAAFFEGSAAERVAIWRDAARRVVLQSPYAALLVSLHARNIHDAYADPAGDPALAAMLEDQRALRDGLIDGLGLDRAAAEADGRRLFALDALSLRLCHRWDDGELPEVDGTTIALRWTGPDAATLDPWPLQVDELEVALHARVLTERFDDEAALHRALDAAPWVPMRWTLRRP